MGQEAHVGKRIISAIKKHSLATEMWLIMAASLLIFCIAFFIALLSATRESRYNAEIRESETLMNSVAANIHANIDNYKDISRLIMLNDEVAAFLKATEVDSGLINDTKYSVMDVLNVSVNLDSVFVLRNDGIYMSTGRGEYITDFSTFGNEDRFKPILEKNGGAVVFMNGAGCVRRKNGNQIITIARAIYDIYTQDRTGILFMNISTNMLSRVVAANKNATLAIISSDGVLLAGESSLAEYYSADNEKGVIVHSDFSESRSSGLISSYSFEEYPLTIITLNSASSYTLPRSFAFSLLLLLMVFIFAMILSSSFIIKKINKPIFELTKAMEKTKDSGWIEKIDMKSPKNEIGTLVDSYNSMIDYLNDLFTKLIDKEKAIQKAEMRVLHEQIKPHFLYNSLSTISYMAYEAGASKVYDALETLGSFYRNFLSKGDREITLRREINIIRDYLSLQKLRYGDILNDEYDIDPSILDVMVPKLILQPLIENCIYHGIRPKGEEGIIRVSGHSEGNSLLLSVYDTGVGMSREAIEHALSGEKGNDPADGLPLSGFGLRGTIDRIRYYCESEDVVQIESVEGEYTDITITIPLKTKKDGKENVQSNDN